MREKLFRTVLAVLLLATTGCGTKRLPYVADAPRGEKMEVRGSASLRLSPGDVVYVYVASRTPETVVRFNEETNMIASTEQRHGYLVSAGGNIQFPVLGLVEVTGMTLEELERDIARRLKVGGYVTDPVVTAELLNFHVTVIGEVRRPQVVFCKGTRLTLFEALAHCGDLTPDGMASNVVVVREVEEGQVVDTVNLTRKEVFDSPCYYLQQNDIVYVEPTARKKRQAYRDTDWVQYMTTGIGLLRIAYRTIYQLTRKP